MNTKHLVKSLCSRLMIIFLILSMGIPVQTALASTGSYDETVPDVDEVGEVVNDDFDNAIVVYTAAYSHSQNITAASTAADDPIIPCAPIDHPDRRLYFTIWYSFTPLTDGDLTVDTLASTSIDTVLAVWTGDRGSLTSAGCNDDYNPAGGIYQSKVEIPVVEGETYYIEIAGISLASVGTWVFNLSANVGIVAPAPIAPSGTINGVAQPTFEWDVYPGSTAYRLAVYSYSSASYVILDTVSNSFCGSTQCAYPSTKLLTNGDYKFKVLGYTPSGITPYGDWMNFTITGVTINPLTPLSPSGTISGISKPTFEWTVYPAATAYKLAVYSYPAAAYLILDTVPSSYCTIVQCSYPSAVNFSNGDYKFKVLAYTPTETTPYSDWLSFTVTDVLLPPPAVPPTPISPSGTVTTHRPTFKWSMVENAAFYRLGVYSFATQTYLILENIYPSCSAGVCSYTHPTIDLPNGDYRFKVLARNSSGMTAYSSYMNFVVSSNLPVAPTLLAPTGTVSTNKPQFKWKPVSGATKYRLAVYSYQTSSYIILTYVSPSACSGSVCTYTPTSALASGDYKFKMLTYNTYGASGYSAFMSFTVP